MPVESHGLPAKSHGDAGARVWRRSRTRMASRAREFTLEPCALDGLNVRTVRPRPRTVRPRARTVRPRPRTEHLRGRSVRLRRVSRAAPRAATAMSASRVRSASSEIAWPARGVELSRPKAAWAAAWAVGLVRSGCRSRSWPASRSTYDRCSSRTCSRACSGRDSQSRSWTMISGRWPSANSTCQSTSARTASAGPSAAATRARPTASSSSLIDTSISASIACLLEKCL